MTERKYTLDSAWSGARGKGNKGAKAREALGNEITLLETDQRRALLDGHSLSMDKISGSWVVILNRVRLYVGPDEDIAVGLYQGITAAIGHI